MTGVQTCALPIYNKKDATNQIALDSIFRKDNNGESVFILDELNSLDIDAQGAILRVLENGEIRKMGSLDQDYVKFLIIGIMNEDPNLIHKKKYLDTFLKDKEIFGGLIGEILYEYFRNIRRLRDDLYFRLIRGGEIIIPSLNERREDIPILFYFLVDKEEKMINLYDHIKEEKNRIINKLNTNRRNIITAKNIDLIVNLIIDMPVYDLLMDESLSWQGNIRELQAVSKLIVQEAKKHIEMGNNNDFSEDSSLKRDYKLDDIGASQNHNCKKKMNFYIRMLMVLELI